MFCALWFSRRQAEDLEDPARVPLRAVDSHSVRCKGRIDVELAGEKFGEDFRGGFEDQARLR